MIFSKFDIKKALFTILKQLFVKKESTKYFKSLERLLCRGFGVEHFKLINIQPKFVRMQKGLRLRRGRLLRARSWLRSQSGSAIFPKEIIRHFFGRYLNSRYPQISFAKEDKLRRSEKFERERKMSIELIKVKTFDEELSLLESILDRNFAAEDRILSK